MLAGADLLMGSLICRVGGIMLARRGKEGSPCLEEADAPMLFCTAVRSLGVSSKDGSGKCLRVSGEGGSASGGLVGQEHGCGPKLRL